MRHALHDGDTGSTGLWAMEMQPHVDDELLKARRRLQNRQGLDNAGLRGQFQPEPTLVHGGGVGDLSNIPNIESPRNDHITPRVHFLPSSPRHLDTQSLEHREELKFLNPRFPTPNLRNQFMLVARRSGLRAFDLPQEVTEMPAPLMPEITVEYKVEKPDIDPAFFVRAILEGDMEKVEENIHKVNLQSTFVVWWRLSPKQEWEFCGFTPRVEDTNSFLDSVLLHMPNDDGRVSAEDFEAYVAAGKIRVFGQLGDSGPYDSKRLLAILNPRKRNYSRDKPEIRFFSDCTYLVLAALVGHDDVFRRLLDTDISCHRRYAYRNGLSGLTWKGNVCFAACISGNLRILQMLINHDPAMLNGRTSLGTRTTEWKSSDLVWEAAYFGRHEIVEYLLSKNAQPDAVSVVCCDRFNSKHTAVHAAARGGSEDHLKVIKLLLGAKAAKDVMKFTDGSPEEVGPVESAITLNHAIIVKYFVEKGFLFPDWETEKEWEKKLEALFKSPNSATIAAVAEGLQSASELQVRRLLINNDTRYDARYLVKFLNTAGSAPVHIMKAIFRMRRLEYIEEEDAKLNRYALDSAHVKEVNVIEAPDHFQNELMAPRRLEPRLKHAVESLQGKHRLWPWADAGWPWSDCLDREVACRSRVDVHYCVLPAIQRETEVLLALCNTRNMDVFKVDGVEAIVEVLWHGVRASQLCQMILNMVLLVALLVFTLNFQASESVFALSYWTMAVIWLLSTCFELRECVGNVFAGYGIFYLSQVWNILHLLFILLSGYAIFSLSTDTQDYRIHVSIVILLRWLQLAFSLRVFRCIGMEVVPILRAVWNTKTFVLLATIVFVGFTNMYVVLNIQGILEAGVSWFRLMWLDDFDIADLEGRNDHYTIGSNNTIVKDPGSGPDLQWVYIRMMVVLAGVTFTVCSMSMYIGILSLRYKQSTAVARQAFNRDRLRVVMQDFVLRYKFLECVKDFDARDYHVWFASRHVSETDEPSQVQQYALSQECQSAAMPTDDAADANHKLMMLVCKRFLPSQEKFVSRESFAECELKLAQIWHQQSQILNILQPKRELEDEKKRAAPMWHLRPESGALRPVGELDEVLANATRLRAEENAQNNDTIRDAEEAQAAVAQALAALKEKSRQAELAAEKMQQEKRLLAEEENRLQAEVLQAEQKIHQEKSRQAELAVEKMQQERRLLTEEEKILQAEILEERRLQEEKAVERLEQEKRLQTEEYAVVRNSSSSSARNSTSRRSELDAPQQQSTASAHENAVAHNSGSFSAPRSGGPDYPSPLNPERAHNSGSFSAPRSGGSDYPSPLNPERAPETPHAQEHAVVRNSSSSSARMSALRSGGQDVPQLQSTAHAQEQAQTVASPTPRTPRGKLSKASMAQLKQTAESTYELD